MSDGNKLRRQLTQRLESLQRAGVTHVPRVSVVAPQTSPGPAGPGSNKPANATVGRGGVDHRGSPNERPAALAPVATPATIAPPSATDRGAGGASSDENPAVSLEKPPKVTPAPRGSLPVVVAPRMEAFGENLPLAARQEALEALCADVKKCRKCPVLVANRTQTVFGVGNLQPRLCFFGEAPGADEDQQGEPFVGKAGQLLNKMIEAMSLRREDVYILNVLKCRPPDNRPPLPDEAENCRPFFERQLDVLRPEYICCLGASAAQALLKTKFSIGKLRGRFFDYGPAKVLATYHPSYLLRNPTAKKPVWEDLQQLMAAMGLERKS